MTGGIILSLICLMFPSGPNQLANGCSAVAGGDDVMSCIRVPACLVRLTGNEYAAHLHADSIDGGRITAMMSRKTESLDFAGGAAWSRTEESSDTLKAIISCARTIRGNPIGFMRGIFGPSISLGAGIEYEYISTEDGDNESGVNGLFGMQFSVFPTVAIGAQVNDLTLYSSADEIEFDPTFEYGITCIFDRNLKVHFSVADTTAALGADLAVTPELTIRSGSDGCGWNFGATLDIRQFTIGYGVLLTAETASHSVGIVFKSGESL